MENQNYESLLQNILQRAKKYELTANDLNTYVLAMEAARKDQDIKIDSLKVASVQNSKNLREIEEEYPLLPPEADDISSAVRRKGVEVMGGKNANAYQNNELRQRVFRDIYSEIKRNYGLIDEKGKQHSYKKLKRKYFRPALILISEYELPIVLSNEVDAENEIED